jgi:hypothetical protein
MEPSPIEALAPMRANAPMETLAPITALGSTTAVTWLPGGAVTGLSNKRVSRQSAMRGRGTAMYASKIPGGTDAPRATTAIFARDSDNFAMSPLAMASASTVGSATSPTWAMSLTRNVASPKSSPDKAWAIEATVWLEDRGVTACSIVFQLGDAVLEFGDLLVEARESPEIEIALPKLVTRHRGISVHD